MSYQAPAHGTHCPDLGTFTGRDGDPRNEDSEAERWAQQLDNASEALSDAAGYVRRENETRADERIKAALFILGEESKADIKRAYELLFKENAELKARIETLYQRLDRQECRAMPRSPVWPEGVVVTYIESGVPA